MKPYSKTYLRSFGFTMRIVIKDKSISMVDPAFSVGGGGRRPIGGADLQRGGFLVEMYAKTKELVPVGVGAPL